MIYNPRSGRQTSRRLLPQLLAALRQSGFAVTALSTRGPGDATQLAREAAAREPAPAVVFALGGDGTLREVAAGLRGRAVALGPLPAGTANVFAAALGLPKDPLQVARACGGYVPQPVDLGLAGDEPFLMMLSCGLDAFVMARQDARLKKHFGRLAIVWSGLVQLQHYTFPELVLRVDDQTFKATFLALANIPLYGGQFRLAPQADWRDGKLDLVLFRGRGHAAALGFARDLVCGRHLARPDVSTRPITAAELVGPPELVVQIDGDVLPLELPLRITVLPQALWVLAPPRPE